MKRVLHTSTQTPKRQALSSDYIYELNRTLMESLEHTNLEGLKQSLEKGADPNGKSTYNGLFDKSFMHVAANIKNVGFIEALITAGGNPNLQISSGTWSPLHQAVFCGNSLVIEYILSKGANVDIYDMNHGTPLLYAVYNNQLEAARLLLEHGADMYHPGYAFRNAIECAVRLDKHDMIKLLIEHGMVLDPGEPWVQNSLKNAISSGNADKAKFLIEHGANLDALEILANDGKGPVASEDHASLDSSSESEQAYELTINDEIINLKLELFRAQNKAYPIMCQLYQALRNGQEIVPFLANPLVQDLIAQNDNLALRYAVDKKHIQAVTHLLRNSSVAQGNITAPLIALATANCFSNQLLDIESIRTQVLNNKELANILLSNEVSNKNFDQAAEYVLHYGADIEMQSLVEALYVSCYGINKLLANSPTITENLINAMEIFIMNINTVNDPRWLLSELASEKADDFDQQALDVIKSLADRTYDGSFIKDLRARMEFDSAESMPLEVLGGRTLKDYVQNLMDENLPEQFEKAGIETDPNSQWCCPILFSAMKIPVTLTEKQVVEREGLRTVESKIFCYDYEGLKQWYKTKNTNPLTRTPITWSDVQPDPAMVERMREALDKKQIHPRASTKPKK